MAKKIICIICVAFVLVLSFPFSAFASTHTHSFDPVPVYDSTHHWQVCTCGATTTKTPHYGGTATTTQKARCSYCNVEYGGYASGSTHAHSYSWQQINRGMHRYACLCGLVMTEGFCANQGGICPTCYGYPTLEGTAVAIYDLDGTYRGTLFTTNSAPKLYFTMFDSGEVSITEGRNLIDDGFAYHYTSGGIDVSKYAMHPAGLSQKNDGNITSDGDIAFDASFDVKIPLEYGKRHVFYILMDEDIGASGSTHTHSYDPVPIYDSTHHWQVCTCGATTTKTPHSGGTATCTTKARCSYCNVEYGETLTHTDTNDDKVCDLCSLSITLPHEHSFDPVPIYDSTHHWQVCTCGATSVKGYHYGGTATCTTKAKCELCMVEYGSTVEHVYGDNEMVCALCGYDKVKDFYELGYKQGYEVGADEGYDLGYQAGYQDRSNEEDSAGFSLYDMIGAIAKAPAQFIESMLDFNVFGVNIASFVKMIFTLLLVLFVVSILFKGV